MKNTDKRIIYCHCEADIIKPERLAAIEAFMTGKGFPFDKVKDLCGICSTQKEKAINLFSIANPVLIIACYPRAVKLLLAYTGIKSKGCENFW